MLNRKQRRAFAKKEHISPKMVNSLLNLLKLGEIHAQHLEDGQKVKINVDRILSRKSPFHDSYVAYVKEHKDQVFTVRHCEEEYQYIVRLEEDPKWIWHVDDLIKVEEQE